MHVTFLGAGTLGRVYGLKLHVDGVDVDFVVRPGRESPPRPMVLEQVNGAKKRDELDRPTYLTSVPPRTDIVIVSVRSDQLVEIAPLLAAAPRAVIVVLTPMISGPPAELGPRVVPAMPSLSGYIDDRDVVRYWTTSYATTLIDDPGADADRRAPLEDLARRLTRAGLPARLERDVGPLNRATTTAFFPLFAGIDAGGDLDGALADKELLALVVDACKETEILAKRVGPLATWAGLLTRFIGPFTLKPAIHLAKRLAPESVHFVDVHFGRKLHTQHLAMGDAILAAAAREGLPMPHLDKLVALLRARS